MTIDVSDVLKAAILKRRSITEVGKNDVVQQMVETAGHKLSQWHLELTTFITATFDDKKLLETFEEAKKEGFTSLVRESFNDKFFKAISKKMKPENFLEASLKKQILSAGQYNFGIHDFEINGFGKSVANDLASNKEKILKVLNKTHEQAQQQLEYSPYTLAPLYEYANKSITKSEFDKKLNMGIDLAKTEYCDKNGKKRLYSSSETEILDITVKLDDLEKIKTDFDNVLKTKKESAPKV